MLIWLIAATGFFTAALSGVAGVGGGTILISVFYALGLAPTSAVPLPFPRGRVDLHGPSAPVISGVSALPFEDVRGQLAAALTRPVRWRETMQTMYSLGVRRYVDVGPDKVLAKLVGRNVPESEAITIEEGSHAHV